MITMRGGRRSDLTTSFAHDVIEDSYVTAEFTSSFELRKALRQVLSWIPRVRPCARPPAIIECSEDSAVADSEPSPYTYPKSLRAKSTWLPRAGHADLCATGGLTRSCHTVASAGSMCLYELDPERVRAVVSWKASRKGIQRTCERRLFR